MPNAARECNSGRGGKTVGEAAENGDFPPNSPNSVGGLIARMERSAIRGRHDGPARISLRSIRAPSQFPIENWVPSAI
jgi:hypothetical protein